jgi:hypothetical protein
MATGYEDTRFETQVDDNLHCVICTEVLKDPVQCRRNEHHFCKNCITEHLKRSRNCPTCKERLTVETLGEPQRFLASTLSSLKISCENSERGCRKVVELGSLEAHVAICDFSPVPCSNDQCEEMVIRRDKETHESKVCDFRRVMCHHCAEIVLYKNFIQHTCPERREVRQMNAEITAMKHQIDKLCSSQDELFKKMENVMSNLAIIERNMRAGRESNAQELQAEIVVAGGILCTSVEVFNMASKTWRPLSAMNTDRPGASSVFYQGHMLVTGGASISDLDSVEKLNHDQQDGHWVESQLKLPAPSANHACVVYRNRLLVIGGFSCPRVYDTIHEIQLTSPFTSRLLTTMPRPICCHGAEIVNDKIYIVGGSKTGSHENAKDTVLMFDPATNTCTELNRLPYRVSKMATVTWKDNVVVLGGRDRDKRPLNTALLYNVTTGSYRMLPAMRRKRYGCTAVIVRDNIIVMGGTENILADIRYCECFSFDTNTWTEFPAMNKARTYATAVVKYR